MVRTASKRADVHDGPNGGKNAFSRYNHKSQLTEIEFVTECNQSMDALLVFAGLFSAVVIQLISVTTQDLKKSDALGNMPIILVVNATFFLSLIASLFSAIVAILVKQWAHRLTSGFAEISSQRKQARYRYQKHKGRKDWAFEHVVAFVPMMLHFALLLFCIGFVFWIKTLQSTLFYLVAATLALIITIYFITAALPLLSSDAPYEWQATTVLKWITKGLSYSFRFLRYLAKALWSCLKKPKPLLIGNDASQEPKEKQEYLPLITIRSDTVDSPFDAQDIGLMMEILRQSDTDAEVYEVFEQLQAGYNRVDTASTAIDRKTVDYLLHHLRKMSSSCLRYIGEEPKQPVLRQHASGRALKAVKFLHWMLQLNFNHFSWITQQDVHIATALTKYGKEKNELECFILGSVVSHQGNNRINGALQDFSCTYLQEAPMLLEALHKWGPLGGNSDDWNNDERKEIHRDLFEACLASLTECMAFHHHPTGLEGSKIVGKITPVTHQLIIGTRSLGIKRLRHYIQYTRKTTDATNRWVGAWFEVFGL